MFTSALMTLLIVSRTLLSSSGGLSSSTAVITQELPHMNLSATQPTTRQIESSDSDVALTLHVTIGGRKLDYNFTLETLKSLHGCLCNDACKSFDVNSDEKQRKVRASQSDIVHQFVCDGFSTEALKCYRISQKDVKLCDNRCTLVLTAVGENCHRGGVDVKLLKIEIISITIFRKYVFDLFHCSSNTCVSWNNQSTTTATTTTTTPTPAPAPTSTTGPHSTSDNTTRKILIAVFVPVGGVSVLVAVSLIVLKHRRRRVHRLDTVTALYTRDDGTSEENAIELNFASENDSV